MSRSAPSRRVWSLTLTHAPPCRWIRCPDPQQGMYRPGRSERPTAVGVAPGPSRDLSVRNDECRARDLLRMQRPTTVVMANNVQVGHWVEVGGQLRAVEGVEPRGVTDPNGWLAVVLLRLQGGTTFQVPASSPLAIPRRKAPGLSWDRLRARQRPASERPSAQRAVVDDRTVACLTEPYDSTHVLVNMFERIGGVERFSGPACEAFTPDEERFVNACLDRMGRGESGVTTSLPRPVGGSSLQSWGRHGPPTEHVMALQGGRQGAPSPSAPADRTATGPPARRHSNRQSPGGR
jgi:hypothetical protein